LENRPILVKYMYEQSLICCEYIWELYKVKIGKIYLAKCSLIFFSFLSKPSVKATIFATSSQGGKLVF